MGLKDDIMVGPQVDGNYTHPMKVDTTVKFTVDGEGTKNDYKDQKNRLELIPPCFTEGVGRVLTYGAVKYEPDNWMRGIQYRRLIGGAKRHLLAIEQGEDKDPETGELHTYHLGCCIAFLSHYMENPAGYSTFDDRVFG